MSKTFKIVLVFLVVVSIVSAVLAVFGFIKKEEEYTRRLMVEEKLAATLKDKRRLEKDIELKEKSIEDKAAEISKMELEIKSFASEMEEEKDKRKSIAADLDDQKKEVQKLKGNLEKEKKEKISISKKLADVKADYVKAQGDISRLSNEKAKLRRDLAGLKKGPVDLDKIVVSPSGGSSLKRSLKPLEELLKGSVLVVNRDYSFIVTDLGQDDNVNKGLKVEIRDGSKLLGRAEIDKVYDTMSSATVLPGSNINNIKKGNLVIESR
ncbi:hypothetical protein ACFL28_01250 [Candidatus Omnitrophota bacterium]